MLGVKFVLHGVFGWMSDDGGRRVSFNIMSASLLQAYAIRYGTPLLCIKVQVECLSIPTSHRAIVSAGNPIARYTAGNSTAATSTATFDVVNLTISNNRFGSRYK